MYVLLAVSKKKYPPYSVWALPLLCTRPVRPSQPTCLLLLKDGALVEGVDLTFLKFITFIGVIAVLVQILEMFLDKFVPALYNALVSTCL